MRVQLSDIVYCHISGEVNMNDWFTEKFVLMDDLAELGFDTTTLRQQLATAYDQFRACIAV